MITGASRLQAIRYISERRCPNGGYCFYRLDEPNAADAWYALSSLSLLDVLSRDAQTESLILGLQRDDGSFPSWYIGYYSLMSLHLLGTITRVPPATWVRTLNPLPDFSGERSVESTSYFEKAFHFMEICSIFDIPPGPDLRAPMIDMVMSHRQADGGFGHPRSTLVETWHAVAILRFLDYPLDLHTVRKFIVLCEDRDYGFLNIPATYPSFLEHFHAGIAVCSLINYRSGFFSRCREILANLQSANGGFFRSVYGGSPTLEFTFLALDSMHMIDHFPADVPDRNKLSVEALRCREGC